MGCITLRSFRGEDKPLPASTLPKPGFRRAVAASGPILSIAQPCFGQTGMKCGQNVADLEHDPENWCRVSEKIMLKQKDRAR